MKSLKITLSVLMFMATLSACKKDKTGPDDPNNPSNISLTPAELTPYYIVAERKTGDGKLTVFTFEQDGSNLKVNLHRQGYLRTTTAALASNTVTIDLDGTGNYVSNFSVEKNSAGQLTLKSYQYTDKGNAAQGFEFAVLAANGSAQKFEDTDFKSGNLLFRFTAAKKIDWDIKERQIGTKYYPPPINQVLPIMGVAPAVSVPYYALGNGSFKANNDFIGAMVPHWKDINSPLLVIENSNIIYQSTKQ